VSLAIGWTLWQARHTPDRKAAGKNNPWSAAFHERLAYVDLQRQDWNEALHESRAALRLNPFLRFARMFLIQFLLHQKDSQRAFDEFETLIKLNPTERESLGRWFATQQRRQGS
jgi:predicted Zn-dependent protease